MPTLNPPAGFTGEFHIDLAVRAAYSEGADPDRIVPDAADIPTRTGDGLLSIERRAQWARPKLNLRNHHSAADRDRSVTMSGG